MPINEAKKTGWKDGREARKEGRPRVSPYAGIKLLRSFDRPWLEGWDAMDAILRREELNDIEDEFLHCMRTLRR